MEKCNHYRVPFLYTFNGISFSVCGYILHIHGIDCPVLLYDIYTNLNFLPEEKRSNKNQHHRDRTENK